MEIDIRRAAQEDLDAAEQLYNDVCSALEAGTNWPGWRQGVYPTRADARRAQAAGALYEYLAQEPPFAVICFKNWSLLTQWRLLTGLTPTQQNVFYRFADWTVA